MNSKGIKLNKTHILEAMEAAAVHYRSGNFEDAKAIYQRVLKEDSNNGDALHFLGLADFSLQNYPAALTSITKAIAIYPNLAPLHSNLGSVLRKIGRISEALESYDQAITLNPKYAKAHLNRGVLLREQGLYSEALASLNHALELDPNDADIFDNYGNALRDLGKFNEAVAMFDYGISLNPDSPEIHMNRGNVLADLKLISKAIASYERSIHLRPGYPEAHLNKAHALLANGQFEEGFELYEWRWRTAMFCGRPRSFAQPLWLGAQSLSEKSILLYAEQGIGDVIQFGRYVKSVSDLGAHVILEVPEKLVSLMKSLDGHYEVFSAESTLPPFDYRCPLMSLPLALKTTLHNIPFAKGYLKADPKRVSQIEQELKLQNPHSKKLCGISWLSKADKTGLFRSIYLKDFITALAKDDFLYVNLQYGEVGQEISEAAKELGISVIHLDSVNLYDDIDGLAAIIEACDLVISIDNTTVHLAGALGKETRVLLPHVPAWRWLLDGKDSPWYESLKLYRQPAVFDWGGAFAQLKEDL